MTKVDELSEDERRHVELIGAGFVSLGRCLICDRRVGVKGRYQHGMFHVRRGEATVRVGMMRYQFALVEQVQLTPVSDTTAC